MLVVTKAQEYQVDNLALLVLKCSLVLYIMGCGGDWDCSRTHCTGLTSDLISRSDTRHQHHKLPHISLLSLLKQVCWWVAVQFIQQKAEERWWFHTAVNYNRGNCWL